MKPQETTTTAKQTGAIDWNEVHRRLETVQIAIEQKLTPPPETKTTILQARAKALAREPERKEAPGESIEVVEFLLAHETYGIESCFVREVYPLKEYTPLPGTPSFVLGIVNVRGQILSVIDLKQFFDLPPTGLTDLNKLLILDSASMTFAVLADAVTGIQSVLVRERQRSLPTLTGSRQAFLKGVTPEGLIVLDAAKLLAHKDIIVRQEVEI